MTELVLVTGAAGWLGRGVVNALVNGLADAGPLGEADRRRKVRCFAQPHEIGELVAFRDAIDVVSGDIRNAQHVATFCEGARNAVVIHAAGIIHPRRIRDFYDVNVSGTRNVLDAAVAAGARRFVAVSSNSPCGTNATSTDVFDEQSPYRPYMNYGRSKMEMEQVVREEYARGRIETTIVRPPWFYGPFQPPRQTLFFEMIRDGKAPIVGSGENRRSMAYIDNLAQGLLLAATTGRANGQTYWIADERPYTMNEIIDTVEALLSREFKFRCRGKRLRLPSVASELALVADFLLQKLGLYQQKIHVLSEMNKTIACSIQKAQAELGYRPRVALEEGMRRSIAWCLERGLLSSGTSGPVAALSD